MSLSGMAEWALAEAHPEQVVWLNLAGDARALSLFQAELVTPGRGALIVLANEGQNADEGLLGPLRRAMAERGVAVMTLGLGAAPEKLRRSRQQVLAVSPVQPRASEPSSVMIDVGEVEGGVQDVSSYLANVRHVLDAAFEALENQGYERIAVAGVGWSAEHVTDWALGRDTLAGVVWLAPKFSAEQRSGLPGLLETERAWRVLDLHGASQRAEGQERAAALGRQQVQGYQRQLLALENPPRFADAERVASRISAWLGR